MPYLYAPSLSDANKTSTPSKDLVDVGSTNNITHKKIIKEGFEEYYKTSDSSSSIAKEDKIRLRMHELITHEYSKMSPHVNGYYYIHMVHGTWKETVANIQSDASIGTYDKEYINQNDKSKFEDVQFNRLDQQFGQLATDIDIPQINIEYESISGKSRNLNYASKIHFAGDFSINFLENYQNDVFRYHETWFKYIDALKKGYINQPLRNEINNPDTETFIEVPYFNAVWVVIFAPFSTNIRGLIKIMGVSPVNLPFKQIIGDRSKSTLTTINQNYKSNDMIHQFFEDEKDQKNSAFYSDFMNDMHKSWNM